MDRKPPPETGADKERIAKVMARAGLCSRREAEAWIAAGRVSVNGERLTTPAFTVSPRDRIEVDGKTLPRRERTRLFLYHKPKGLVTTNRDERGRPTIFGALPKELPRLVSIGRLDINSEGLLLLTNDGGLARVLELPQTGWLRRYRVRANGSVDQPALERLARGITVDGIEYGPITATLDREQGSNVWLTMGLREGKNREVRNVLRVLGLTVNRLIRVSYGPFRLGELAPGAVEEVNTRVLREQLGEKIARLAGADFAADLREPASQKEPPPKRPKPARPPSRQAKRR
jgi:23S rRNA pseudouridine2605 synthase